MTEEYELSAYDRHELNYDQVALGRLPMNTLHDYMVQPVAGVAYLSQGSLERQEGNSRTVTES